jgi:DNA-binding NtrC family response regulator
MPWIDRLHQIWGASRTLAGPPLEFQAAAVEALLLQPWPDNLRGLQRVVHSCATAAPREPLTRTEVLAWLADPEPRPASPSSPSAIPVPTPMSTPPGPRQRRPRPSREELLAVLTRNAGSIRATAKHFDRERKQISRWIEMYAITTETPAEDDAEGD